MAKKIKSYWVGPIEHKNIRTRVYLASDVDNAYVAVVKEIRDSYDCDGNDWMPVKAVYRILKTHLGVPMESLEANSVEKSRISAQRHGMVSEPIKGKPAESSEKNLVVDCECKRGEKVKVEVERDE